MISYACDVKMDWIGVSWCGGIAVMIPSPDYHELV